MSSAGFASQLLIRRRGSTWRALWVHDGGRWVPGRPSLQVRLLWPPLPAAAHLCPGSALATVLCRERLGPLVLCQVLLQLLRQVPAKRQQGPGGLPMRTVWPSITRAVLLGYAVAATAPSTLGRGTALRSGGEASVLGAGWTRDPACGTGELPPAPLHLRPFTWASERCHLCQEYPRVEIAVVPFVSVCSSLRTAFAGLGGLPSSVGNARLCPPAHPTSQKCLSAHPGPAAGAAMRVEGLGCV